MGPTEKRDKQNVSRRHVLAGLLGATTAGLAGCERSDTATPTGTAETVTATPELEILHRWTRGTDGAAMSALLQAFGRTHDVRILENTLRGQANANMKTVIRDRMLDSDPPSTWQTWPGKNLTDFTDENLLGDIGDEVWTSDMRSAYVDGAERAAKPDGTYVCVPLNIHRLNPLFYNVAVLEDAGVHPSGLDTLDALIDALDAVVTETDATPLAKSLAEPWTALQFWETLFLATGGHDQYQTFTDGDPRSAREPARDALQAFSDLRPYFSADAAEKTWPDAAEQLRTGDAAFFHQGDWAAGVYNDAAEMTYGTDWDWIPFPGTRGLYAIVMDGFPFPTPNRSPEMTIEFLRFVGSTRAQELFNPVKGSIPPRQDISTDGFSDYQVDQIQQFRDSREQPNSIAHGLAVTPAERSALLSATAEFVSTNEIDATLTRFIDALR